MQRRRGFAPSRVGGTRSQSRDRKLSPSYVGLWGSLVRIPEANADEMQTIADQLLRNVELAWGGSMESARVE